MRAAAIVLVLGLFVLLGAVLFNSIILPNVAFTDTLPVYNSCQWFYQGVSPYQESVTLDTQARIAAQAPAYEPSIDEHRFAYPAHLCVVMAPVFWLPYEQAAPLWMSLNFVMFLVLPLLYVRGVLGITLKTWMLLTLLGWRYAMIVIVLAQYTGLTLAALVGALWALKHRQQTIAAICLVLLTLRPESAVIALILLLYAWWDQQRRAVVAFGVMLLAFYALTALFAGLNWPLDFVNRIVEYSTYRTHSSQWLPLLYGPISLIPTIVLCAAGVWLFAKKVRQFSREDVLIWGSGLAILLQLVLVPQTNSYTLVYALPVIYLMFISGGNAFRVTLFLTVGLLPWLYQIHTDRFILGTEQFVFPIVTLAAFVVVLWREIPANREDEKENGLTSASP